MQLGMRDCIISCFSVHIYACNAEKNILLKIQTTVVAGPGALCLLLQGDVTAHIFPHLLRKFVHFTFGQQLKTPATHGLYNIRA